MGGRGVGSVTNLQGMWEDAEALVGSIHVNYSSWQRHTAVSFAQGSVTVQCTAVRRWVLPDQCSHMSARYGPRPLPAIAGQRSVCPLPQPFQRAP